MSGCSSIAIVVPPSAQLLDVSGPLDAFLEANRQSGGSANYKPFLIAINEDKIVQANGISLVADSSIFDDDRHIDTLLIVGTLDYAMAYKSTVLHTWLRRRAALARRCGSVGTGAFFLGEAGLLDGMTATTHWQHTAELAERYPAAKILPNHNYVKDGALHTSAGVWAGIALALELIEGDHGRELARKVAHRLIVSFKDIGRQPQFGARLAAQDLRSDHIKAVEDWIQNHLALDLTVKTMAGRAALGPRQFTRIFQAETGMTPADFVKRSRVEAAMRLIKASNMLLRDIASNCGFANQDVMRQIFRRKFGATPSFYRKKKAKC